MPIPVQVGFLSISGLLIAVFLYYILNCVDLSATVLRVDNYVLAKFFSYAADHLHYHFFLLLLLFFALLLYQVFSFALNIWFWGQPCYAWVVKLLLIFDV